MVNYDIVINEDFSWSVLELQTDQIIDTFFFEDDAKDYAKFLDRGGGFDGWTPSFMTVKSFIDINDIFDAEFS